MADAAATGFADKADAILKAIRGLKSRQPARDDYTDIEAARVLREGIPELRWCSRTRSWWHWSGWFWESISSEAALRHVLDWLDLPHGGKCELPETWQRRLLGLRCLKSALESLAALAEIDVDMLDSSTTELNTPEGIYDLTAKPCTKPKFWSRQRWHTRITPIAPAVGGHPKFDAFLNLIFCGNRELIEYWWRAFGYSITGETREQVCFILHGGGQNGKSTLLDVMSGVVGRYMVTSDGETLIRRKRGDARSDLVRTRGARIIRSSETAKDAELDEPTVKVLTGESTMVARTLYQQEQEWHPTGKIWLLTNHRPKISGVDKGIWRRIHLIPFEAEISDAQRQHDYHKTLLEAEGPAILAEAIERAREWWATGLRPPQAVSDATMMYRDDSDPLGSFFQDCCVRGADESVTPSDLYESYKSWCATDAGIRQPWTRNRFNAEMSDRSYRKKPIRVNGSDPRVRWIGLRVKGQMTQ